MHMYAGLAKLTGRYTFESEKDIEVGTALTYIGLFLVHTAKYFNICLRYPVCFNGSKSFIVRDQYRQYSLNPGKSSTQTSLKHAITMMAENIQFVWSFINANSRSNVEQITEEEKANLALVRNESSVAMSPSVFSRQADEFNFGDSKNFTL